MIEWSILQFKFINLWKIASNSSIVFDAQNMFASNLGANCFFFMFGKLPISLFQCEWSITFFRSIPYLKKLLEVSITGEIVLFCNLFMVIILYYILVVYYNFNTYIVNYHIHLFQMKLLLNIFTSSFRGEKIYFYF